jgi:hypothetical protein
MLKFGCLSALASWAKKRRALTLSNHFDKRSTPMTRQTRTPIDLRLQLKVPCLATGI